jgi:hypothetical protein
MEVVAGKRIKRTILIAMIALGMVGANLLIAGVPSEEAFGATVETTWYGSIPSAFHEDELPIRSHLSLGGSITPFAFGLSDAWELSAGVTGFYTTRSMIYGTTVWRPFAALGLAFDATYHLDQQFSITGGSAVFLSMYTQTREFAPLWRLKMSAGYELLQNPGRNRLVLSIPVSVDVRTDYISVSSGIGITWRFERKQKEAM